MKQTSCGWELGRGEIRKKDQTKPDGGIKEGMYCVVHKQ